MRIITSMASTTITKNIMSLNEFPVLGTKISKDQERNIRLLNLSERTREQARRYEARTHEYTRYELAKGETTSSNESYVFTKPCKNVTDGTTESFGVCTRSVCTFAHSLQELKIPKCRFMSNCRSKFPCKFLHPDETVDAWILRTGEKLPNLPPTNDNSRRPESTPSPTSDITTTPAPPLTLASINSYTNSYTNQHPISTPSFTDKQDPRFQDPQFRDPRFQDPRFQDPQFRDPRFQNQIPVPFERSEPSYRKKLEFELHCTCPEGKVSYIAVPTEELALIAVKAAFDNGNYEIKISKIYR